MNNNIDAGMIKCKYCNNIKEKMEFIKLTEICLECKDTVVKQCTMCLKTKPLIKFHRRNEKCDNCCIDVAAIVAEGEGVKIKCKVCDILKTTYEYEDMADDHVCTIKCSGVNSHRCKQCRSDLLKEKRRIKKEAERGRPKKEIVVKEPEKCSECRCILTSENKQKDRKKCVTCYKNYKKQNYDSSKKEILEKQREKRNGDLEGKIKKIVCNRIYKATGLGTHEAFKLLGCDIEYFMIWIESFFNNQNNLNWENYGIVWQFDHVNPCRNFDYSKEGHLQECFNWKNVRPVTTDGNKEKGCTVYGPRIQEQKKIAEEYEKNHPIII